MHGQAIQPPERWQVRFSLGHRCVFPETVPALQQLTPGPGAPVLPQKLRHLTEMQPSPDRARQNSEESTGLFLNVHGKAKLFSFDLYLKG